MFEKKFDFEKKKGFSVSPVMYEHMDTILYLMIFIVLYFCDKQELGTKRNE